MKVNWNSKYNTITAYSLIVIFSSILFYFFASQIGSYSAKVGYLISIMYPFIIGFVLAYLLNFILKFYEERIKYQTHCSSYDGSRFVNVLN